jgi:hypothetical protein
VAGASYIPSRNHLTIKQRGKKELTWFPDQCALGYQIQSIRFHWSFDEAAHIPSPSIHSPGAAWLSLHALLRSMLSSHCAEYQKNAQCILLQITWPLVSIQNTFSLNSCCEPIELQ